MTKPGPADPAPAGTFAVWTPSQRRVVAGFVLVVSVVLLALRWVDPVTVPDPPGTGGRADELSSPLDPNTADAVALSALPTLGEKRARDVVAYRDAWAHDHPGGRPAFAQARDLMRVRGIGPSVSAAIAPFLRFPPAIATRRDAP